MRLSKNDPSSYAQPDVSLIKQMHLSLDVNFEKKILSGSVNLSVEKIQPEINELILDVKDLKIAAVNDCDTKEKLEYKISDDVPNFGQKLTIFLRKNSDDNNKNVNVSINYETSSDASGLQWLGPDQTSNKKHPFMFSQCQAVHARSIVPCQDTPAVKMPYTAEISAPSELTVLMSAIRSKNTTKSGSKTVTTFDQKVPIPSYLIAIAVGKLESRKVGERCSVWAEPEVIENAAFEFNETEKMLTTAEEICGPYVWGVYDLLVLPPSFPFGGMENPCLTFVTPTLIAGDRSLALVVAHEIAHSWTGNLVTNRNFEHFWLNEGFTVFVERKIAGRMKGPSVQDFEATTGVNTLKETIDKLGETNPLTQLVLNLDGVHPDDSFSSVPYEKGNIFLRFLENTIGGPEKFEPFLKMYLNKYKFKSIDTNDFKREFETYFSKNPEITSINWNEWLDKPGMPPVIPKYDDTLVKVCQELKDKWIKWDENDEGSFSSKDIAEMNSNQLDYFLQLLLECDPLPLSKLRVMDALYSLSDMKNCEIRFRWIRIAIKAKWMDKLGDALKMVTEVGRMKYIRPISQDLYKWEEAREKAIETFKSNRKCMMHVSAYTVSKDLHLE